MQQVAQAEHEIPAARDAVDLARRERAARWRLEEAERLAVMGDAAGSAEGVRRLRDAGLMDAECAATLISVLDPLAPEAVARAAKTSRSRT